MSSGQEATPPPKDTYANGAPRAADPTTALTDKERATLTKILANPLDFPQEFPGWLDDFVRLRLTVSNIPGLSTDFGATGELIVVLADYTAQTGVYTISHRGGTWMYLNGATFTAADYPDLNTYLGGNTLPDTRGRSIWLTGTHSATDLFDNDGVTESSRQPKHTHTDSLSVGKGTLAASVTDPGHTHNMGFELTAGRGPGADSNTVANPGSGKSTGSATTGIGVSITGAPSISGSVGSGMSGSDAVAHIVLGSAFVHV